MFVRTKVPISIVDIPRRFIERKIQSLFPIRNIVILALYSLVPYILLVKCPKNVILSLYSPVPYILLVKYPKNVS